MKIFASILPNSACDYHRIVNPLRYMMGIEVVTDTHDADIFFFNKTTECSLYKLKDKGVKIVMDIDDYWQLPEDHPYYADWQGNQITERIIGAMGVADGVITTNELLAERIRFYNRNVHVVPNALPYGHGQFNLPQSDWTGTVKYVGGWSHVNDVKLIPGYRIPPRLPVESYMQHYAGANIALAPLADNEFNRYKSNLKILEAGAAFAHCLCSDVTPFHDAPVAYVDPGYWQETIVHALQYPEYAQLCGQKLNMWCREYYDLPKVNVLRKRVLESL